MDLPKSAYKGGEVPGPQDGVFALLGAFSSVFQAAITTKTAFGSAIPKTSNDFYDPGTQSWAGEQILRYRVPLLDLPSERHAQSKVRNIRILLDNCRNLCVNDLLPCTSEEKEFWTNYRMLKYQLFLTPFGVCSSLCYITAKLTQKWLPSLFRGRITPIMLGGIIAEQYMEANFPAYELLNHALIAKTPLGDAARAEWQRLQPAHISAAHFAAYQIRNWVRDPIEGFQFGGNVTEAVS